MQNVACAVSAEGGGSGIARGASRDIRVRLKGSSLSRVAGSGREGREFPGSVRRVRGNSLSSTLLTIPLPPPSSTVVIHEQCFIN